MKERKLGVQARDTAFAQLMGGNSENSVFLKLFEPVDLARFLTYSISCEISINLAACGDFTLIDYFYNEKRHFTHNTDRTSKIFCDIITQNVKKVEGSNLLNYLAKCFFIVPTSFNYLSSSDLDENDWETFLQSVFVSDDHNLMSFYIDLTLKMHQSDVSIINANQMFIFKNLDAFSFLLKSYFEHYKLVPSYLSFFREVIQLGSNKSASLLVDSVIECDNSEKLSRCFNAVFRVASL